jgi:hypothetical protein
MHLYKSTKSFRRLLLVFLVLPMNMLFAGPYSDALGKKLVASTTPAEKAICVRWMFVAMALHPDLKDMASVTAEQREEANRAFAKLVTRMLTETCATEAREAVRYEGSSAIESAFNIFGQVAGRELFTNPAVSKGLADLVKFCDTKAIQEALTEAPVSSETK